MAWVGFTLERTVFDSGRSERLAATLLDDDEVQAVLVQRTVNALEATLPAAATSEVSTAELERGARSALASPEVDAALRAAVVGTHRYLLGEVTEPPAFRTAPLDEAVRARLAAVDPALAEAVPELPTLDVQLPDAGLSIVRSVREATEQVTRLAALVALIGLGGALLIARDRGRVLRRVGIWALAAGGTWVVLAYGLPALAEALLPEGAALVGALVDVVAGGMVGAGAGDGGPGSPGPCLRLASAAGGCGVTIERTTGGCAATIERTAGRSGSAPGRRSAGPPAPPRSGPPAPPRAGRADPPDADPGRPGAGGPDRAAAGLIAGATGGRSGSGSAGSARGSRPRSGSARATRPRS